MQFLHNLLGELPQDANGFTLGDPAQIASPACQHRRPSNIPSGHKAGRILTFVPLRKPPCPAGGRPVILVHCFVHQFLRRRRFAIKLIPQDVALLRQITDHVQQVAPAVYPPGTAYKGYDLLLHNGDMLFHIHAVQIVIVKGR